LHDSATFNTARPTSGQHQSRQLHIQDLHIVCQQSILG